MDVIQLLSFALASGLTAAGLACSVLELVLGQHVHFGEPYVSSAHLPRSLLVLLLAGPLMLGNDALAAYRANAISPSSLAACAGASGLWATATGLLLMTAVACASGVLG